MTPTKEMQSAPLLLVLGLGRDNALIHVSTEHDRPRAEIVANTVVSNGTFPFAWVVEAMYQATPPPDNNVQ